ncbi:MAG TPA: tetratricopeptide repeat protein [Bryobacteraceae bacterium]|nr:tetratricopeptide repeat protein [Bryobacteraceae bacterium]
MILPLAIFLSLAASPVPQKPLPPPAFDEVSKQAAQARETNRLDEAIRLYREAVRLRPSWTEGWWYLGTMLYDQDRYPEAVTALRHFTELDAKVAPGWALLGLCEYQTKKYAPALAHIEQARHLGLGGNPEMDKVVQYHAALLLTRSGKFEAALEIFTRLVRRNEETPSMIEAAGIAALRKPILPEELAAADRELVLNAGRAVLDAAARRAAQAQTDFEQLVKNYPAAPNVHYLFGSFLLASNPDQGLAELKEELNISPRHVPALLQVALEYLKRGDAQAALPYAKKAVEIDAGSFAAHYALGRALVESGDLAKGVAELEISREQAPNSPQTRVALASAYAKAGRKQDAARERAAFLNLEQLAKKQEER